MYTDISFEPADTFIKIRGKWVCVCQAYIEKGEMMHGQIETGGDGKWQRDDDFAEANYDLIIEELEDVFKEYEDFGARERWHGYPTSQR